MFFGELTFMRDFKFFQIVSLERFKAEDEINKVAWQKEQIVTGKLKIKSIFKILWAVKVLCTVSKSSNPACFVIGSCI